jgi:hypothetical protein
MSSSPRGALYLEVLDDQETRIFRSRRRQYQRHRDTVSVRSGSMSGSELSCCGLPMAQTRYEMGKAKLSSVLQYVLYY